MDPAFRPARSSYRLYSLIASSTWPQESKSTPLRKMSFQTAVDMVEWFSIEKREYRLKPNKELDKSISDYPLQFSRHKHSFL